MKSILKSWLSDKAASAMFVVAVIIEVVYAILNSQVTVLISEVVSSVPFSTEMLNNLAILSTICVMQVVFCSVARVLMSRAIEHCYRTTSTKYVDKVLTADVSLFSKFSTSRVLTVFGHCNSITDAAKIIKGIIQNIVTIVVTLVAMYAVAGPKVLFVIIIYLVGVLLMKIIYKKFSVLDKAKSKTIKTRNQQVENIVLGFSEVRSFCTEAVHRKTISGLNDEICSFARKKNLLIAMLIGFVNLVDAIGLVFILLYCGWQMNLGVLNQAQAMSLVMFVFKIIDPLLSLMDSTGSLSEITALVDDYEKIINYKDADDPGEMRIESFENEIVIEDLSFSYADSTACALQHLNMSIKKGTKVGICGESGGGKTTLLKLLQRAYNPSNGAITIDGLDVRQISMASYRNLIGVVNQEPVIFPGTIKENILYGSFGKMEYQVIDACKKAKILDFIETLPEGFDTQVGPRGLKLSGGQKQRIALARLFLRDPQIVILDEATSALDNESETVIQEALDSLKNKTVITVAHRLSTIQNSDVIYVLGNHTVLESGSHEELLKKKGIYYRMQK